MFVVEAPDPTELNEYIDRARRTGARLVGLTRDVRYLEEVLAEALGQGAERGSA